MSAEVRVVDDPAAAAAGLIVDVMAAGGHLVLTGGSTARSAYELIAAQDPDWSGVTVWLTDERCVPPDDPLSNWRMIAGSLLDRLSGGHRPRARRMEGERGHQAGADAYEELLRAESPRFDLALIGLGADAHIASLFPGKPEVAERSRLAVGVPEAGMEPRVPRVSLTLPALSSAERRVFLVMGADKREAVARCFGSDPDPEAPGAMVPDPLVLLDEAAAEGLR